MTVYELSLKLMRRAEEAVELSRSLYAEAYDIRSPEEDRRWQVRMGDAIDDRIVGRFQFECDACEFAEDLNRALRPIVERRCLTVLSSCMNEMAEGLATVEQG